MKIFLRSRCFIKGFLFSLKVKATGGICKGIPFVESSVFFKNPPHSGISIGKGCRFGKNIYIDVPVGAKLIIGDRVKLTGNTLLSAANELKVGDNSLIAENVSIRDSEHSYDAGKNINEQSLKNGKVIIGKDVWVGCNTVILMNSVIEDGSVVGASSLVRKTKLQENGIYAGCPVRFIKKRS